MKGAASRAVAHTLSYHNAGNCSLFHHNLYNRKKKKKWRVTRRKTKRRGISRTMLDWSWITDSLLSNLYAVHALSVHVSIKSPMSAHSRHHGSPTSLQTFSEESGRTVRCGHILEVGIADALRESLSLLHALWTMSSEKRESYNAYSPCLASTVLWIS